MTAGAILKNLNDMAGVRVICEYVYDLYAMRDTLMSGGGIRLIKEKDYIASPKSNGYRSHHLITEISVPLYNGEQLVRCEIQLRTTAMDAWAGLEHNLRYKKGRPYDAEIDKELRNCAGGFPLNLRTGQYG